MLSLYKFYGISALMVLSQRFNSLGSFPAPCSLGVDLNLVPDL